MEETEKSRALDKIFKRIKEFDHVIIMFDHVRSSIMEVKKLDKKRLKNGEDIGLKEMKSFGETKKGRW